MGTSCCKNNNEFEDKTTSFIPRQSILDITIPELRRSIETLNDDMIKLQAENINLSKENKYLKTQIIDLKLELAEKKQAQATYN